MPPDKPKNNSPSLVIPAALKNICTSYALHNGAHFFVPILFAFPPYTHIIKKTCQMILRVFSTCYVTGVHLNSQNAFQAECILCYQLLKQHQELERYYKRHILFIWWFEGFIKVTRRSCGFRAGWYVVSSVCLFICTPARVQRLGVLWACFWRCGFKRDSLASVHGSCF